MKVLTSLLLTLLIFSGCTTSQTDEEFARKVQCQTYLGDFKESHEEFNEYLSAEVELVSYSEKHNTCIGVLRWQTYLNYKPTTEAYKFYDLLTGEHVFELRAEITEDGFVDTLTLLTDLYEMMGSLGIETMTTLND